MKKKNFQRLVTWSYAVLPFIAAIFGVYGVAWLLVFLRPDDKTLQAVVDNKYVQTLVGTFVGYLLARTQNDKKLTLEQLVEKREKIYAPLRSEIVATRRTVTDSTFPALFLEKTTLRERFSRVDHLLTWFMKRWIDEDQTHRNSIAEQQSVVTTKVNQLFQIHCEYKNLVPRVLTEDEMNEVVSYGRNPVVLHDKGLGYLADQKIVIEVISKTKVEALKSDCFRLYRASLEKYRKYLLEMEEVATQCELQILKKVNRVYYL